MFSRASGRLVTSVGASASLRPRHVRRLSNPSAASIDVSKLRDSEDIVQPPQVEQVARFTTLVDRRGEFYYELDDASLDPVSRAFGDVKIPVGTSKLLSDDLLYL